jgi:DNA-binding response OmpR family regulator
MTAPRQKTIVVLDDSRIVLETLDAALTARNFVVLTAENLSELEHALASGRPDLFILDVQMPEAFGDDVGQILRVVRRFEAPILLFSALDDASLAERSSQAGLDGYVSKNSGIGPLLERVAQLMGPDQSTAGT